MWSYIVALWIMLWLWSSAGEALLGPRWQHLPGPALLWRGLYLLLGYSLAGLLTLLALPHSRFAAGWNSRQILNLCELTTVSNGLLVGIFLIRAYWMDAGRGVE